MKRSKLGFVRKYLYSLCVLVHTDLAKHDPTWFHSVRFLGQRRGKINEWTSLCRVKSNRACEMCMPGKKTLFYYQHPWNEWKNYAGDEVNACLYFTIKLFPKWKRRNMCLSEDYLCFLTNFFLSFTHPPVVPNLDIKVNQKKKFWICFPCNYNGDWRYKSYKRIHKHHNCLK